MSALPAVLELERVPCYHRVHAVRGGAVFMEQLRREPWIEGGPTRAAVVLALVEDSHVHRGEEAMQSRREPPRALTRATADKDAHGQAGCRACQHSRIGPSRRSRPPSRDPSHKTH
eukprot:CAMPEP_0185284122 /NCGR_PEP_ID=MMETSP1363-20130426/888_1 /TAXON_ID=38817 /ORGANISM="Gephyrocapsa oceanica, Strain RCC1303" /LENGTH=115 /DNA_ID=CAMNT_0027879811 /DNA_START=411 /DNA_END=755 /DNA_ORIENTATION=-